jgi:hypothetical protein
MKFIETVEGKHVNAARIQEIWIEEDNDWHDVRIETGDAWHLISTWPTYTQAEDDLHRLLAYLSEVS